MELIPSGSWRRFNWSRCSCFPVRPLERLFHAVAWLMQQYITPGWKLMLFLPPRLMIIDCIYPSKLQRNACHHFSQANTTFVPTSHTPGVEFKMQAAGLLMVVRILVILICSTYCTGLQTHWPIKNRTYVHALTSWRGKLDIWFVINVKKKDTCACSAPPEMRD